MMSKLVTKVVVDAIRECGKEYNFDGDSASLKWLSRQVSVSKKCVIQPFSGEYDGSCCESVRHNRGLYTQCESKKVEGSALCQRCACEVTRNGGASMFGTMSERKAVGIMEYKDPKGRSPVMFVKVMRKLKLTREMVEEDANKKGRSIAEVHFEESVSKRGRPSSPKEDVKEKKAKGRPSKSKKVLEMEDETVDLFANMVKNAVLDDMSSSDEEVVEVEEQENEEVAKEQEKAAEKVAKEQEKVAKAAEKEAKKAASELKKGGNGGFPPVEEGVNGGSPPVEEEDSVVEIEYEGKKYLKSVISGAVYDMEENEIGKWNNATNKIDLRDDSDCDEEEEEEYE